MFFFELAPIIGNLFWALTMFFFELAPIIEITQQIH